MCVVINQNRILRGRCSDEERDAYQDIYNALDKLALKYDDNDYDSLSMEVIDITSKWASEFKNTTINFAKVSKFLVNIQM